jgi:hypothetical protein
VFSDLRFDCGSGHTTVSLQQTAASPESSLAPMAQITQSRRTRTFVDPEVQGGLLRKIAFHWLVLLTINAMMLLVWTRLFEQPESTWRQTVADCVQRFLPFLVISIAVVPAFLWDTLKLTHRFAGPALRFRAALSDAAQGHAVAPMNFRHSDFWQEMADAFNLLLERQEEALAQSRSLDCLEPSIHE